MTTLATLAPETAASAPAQLLSELIRFRSANPPGAERDCILYLQSLLDAAGFATRLVARDSERPNLVARLPGRGDAPPLLMHGHVDVVPAAPEGWQRDPFGGEVADGFVWGRGALDMKGAVAMIVAAALRAAGEAEAPAADLVLALMVDEETGSDHGAAFLVSEHAELFAGVRYAIGEGGAMRMKLMGREVYPVQVAEKQVCWIRATFTGEGGHASFAPRGGAAGKLAKAVAHIEEHPLPVHMTPVVSQMLSALLPQWQWVERARGASLLADLASRTPVAAALSPLVRNTACPTILESGDQVNVAPASARLTIDARLLPGFTPDRLFSELEPALRDHAELEVLRFDRGLKEPDLALFALLEGVLHDADPSALAVPLLLPAVTDGRFFALLGIQHYGFSPMRLTPGLDFRRLIHGVDERIPVEDVEFGTACIHEVIRRYRTSA
jgi:acetylornithine deacetylase/succinyl-diaminopimelate desuccinylase-like protein